MNLFDLPPDENRGIIPLAVHVVLTFIALGVVAFRSVAGMATSDGLKADDYTMLLGMFITTVNLGFTIAGTAYGQGRHIFYLGLENIVKAVRMMFVIQFLLPLALAVVKLSVTLFLLRIVGSRKWLRWPLIASIVALYASTFAYTIILWIQCRPLAVNWDPRVGGRDRCYPVSVIANVSYVVTACTILTDFLCALLPMPIIWNLKMDRKTKASIAALMGLGLFAGACAIIRMTYVSSFFIAHNDPTWILVPLGVWTMVELHVAIIVGSIPPCRALFLRLWSRLRTFSAKSESSSLEQSCEKPAPLAWRISLPFSRKYWTLKDHHNHQTRTTDSCSRESKDKRSKGSVPALVDSTRAPGGHMGNIVKTSNVTITTTARDGSEELEERCDVKYGWN